MADENRLFRSEATQRGDPRHHVSRRVEEDLHAGRSRLARRASLRWRRPGERRRLSEISTNAAQLVERNPYLMQLQASSGTWTAIRQYSCSWCPATIGPHPNTKTSGGSESRRPSRLPVKRWRRLTCGGNKPSKALCANLRPCGRSLTDSSPFPARCCPSGYWQSFDLPVPIGGALLEFRDAGRRLCHRRFQATSRISIVLARSGLSILEISEAQVGGSFARNRRGQQHPVRTRRGRAVDVCVLHARSDWLATYLVLSSDWPASVRRTLMSRTAIPCWAASTALGRRTSRRTGNGPTAWARETLEGAIEPDRRYER